MRRKYCYMEQLSGVGVIDKAVAILSEVGRAPATLADLSAKTGQSRATAYRLACALEFHGLLSRDDFGRWGIGTRLAELARNAGVDPIVAAAEEILDRLRNRTGESAQLYRRIGDTRRCIAAAERASGLRDTVPVGSELPMTAGSAAQVLLAWDRAAQTPALLRRAAFTASTLSTVRRRGWAASVGQREAGVASVSAPVFDENGLVVAALSVSGPIDRLTRSPGNLHAPAVMGAAAELSQALRA